MNFYRMIKTIIKSVRRNYAGSGRPLTLKALRDEWLYYYRKGKRSYIC